MRKPNEVSFEMSYHTLCFAEGSPGSLINSEELSLSFLFKKKLPSFIWFTSCDLS